MHLSVDKNNFIFVADRDNNRIVVLNSSLEFSHLVNLSTTKWQGPERLHLDESRDRLYVGVFPDGPNISGYTPGAHVTAQGGFF